MAKAWWVLALLGCACSDPDESDEPVVPSAYLTLTLSEPTGYMCLGAAPSAYLVGTESAPLTNGKDLVRCVVHSAEKYSWFEANLQGVAEGGFNVGLFVSTEADLAVTLVSDLTGTVASDSPMAAACSNASTAIIGNSAYADFDCPLLVDPVDPTYGCGVSGSVTFENCETE